MSVENWGAPGMPPDEVDVLDRWVIPHSDDAEQRTEFIWVKGYRPHAVRIIGETGEEYFIEKDINGTERIRTIFYNLPDYHPLYDAQRRNRNT